MTSLAQTVTVILRMFKYLMVFQLLLHIFTTSVELFVFGGC